MKSRQAVYIRSGREVNARGKQVLLFCGFVFQTAGDFSLQFFCRQPFLFANPLGFRTEHFFLHKGKYRLDVHFANRACAVFGFVFTGVGDAIRDKSCPDGVHISMEFLKHPFSECFFGNFCFFGNQLRIGFFANFL